LDWQVLQVNHWIIKVLVLLNITVFSIKSFFDRNKRPVFIHCSRNIKWWFKCFICMEWFVISFIKAWYFNLLISLYILMNFMLRNMPQWLKQESLCLPKLIARLLELLINIIKFSLNLKNVFISYLNAQINQLKLGPGLIHFKLLTYLLSDVD
jgi:hypothetical protein